MEFQRGVRGLVFGESGSYGCELYGYEVVGNILGGLCEGVKAIVFQKVCFCFVGTSYFEYASFELEHNEVVEPFSTVYRVGGFDSVENPGKNFRGILHRRPLFPLINSK